MATPNGKQNTCESLCMMSVITVAGYDTFHKQRTPMIRFTCQIVSYMNFLMQQIWLYRCLILVLIFGVDDRSYSLCI